MGAKKTIAIRTVGCRANQADSATLARALDPERFELVDDLSGADAVVINTCCVTAEAERDCRKLARRALRESPGCRVILTGCAVSAVEGFGSDLGDGVVTIGGGDLPFERIADLVSERLGGEGEAVSPVGAALAPGGRTRALLKVQNGCEHNCAYCIVPAARGPQISMPLAEVMAEVDRIVATGTGEIVLTGVQIGAWGSELPGRPRLARLLEAVADRFDGGRVRLSSVEPWSVDEALIDVVAGHGRVCPHLHVPLQSGDDGVLARMGRGYDAADFASRIESAKERIDGLAFGTDVICGFPGEDEAAFENTLALLERLEPAYVHGFSYSPRPGTMAFEMSSPGREAAKARVRRVRDLGEELAAGFRRSQIGAVREAIVEDAASGRGLTDNFVQVRIDGGSLEDGRLVAVEILGLGSQGIATARLSPRRT